MSLTRFPTQVFVQVWVLVMATCLDLSANLILLLVSTQLVLLATLLEASSTELAMVSLLAMAICFQLALLAIQTLMGRSSIVEQLEL